MFERRVRMWQNLRLKELRFSTKDSATSTWRVLRSWRQWSMAQIWKKCHCTMCVKLALKENIKGHLFLKMKRLGLPSFWNLCIAMCANQWRPHLMVEHDTLSPSSTIFQKNLMFTFWKQKAKCLTNSRHTRPWWKIKPAWRSKPYDSTMEENLCQKSLMIFLRECGIQRQTSAPYTPQQDGVAEWVNRTIMKCARSMIRAQGLDLEFWAKVVNTAIYIKNRCPTKAFDSKTPQEAWTGAKPDVSHLRIFGCKTFTHIHDEKRRKLESKSIPCVFLGYCEGTKTYCLMCVETKMDH